MNCFIVNQKDRMIWADVPEPKYDGNPDDDRRNYMAFIGLKTAWVNRSHYPYSTELNWRDQQRVEEGKDFELKKEWVMTGRKDEYDGSMDKYQRTIAIPLPSKEEFGYCQSEIEDKGKCEIQCNHCKEYYAPLEKQMKENTTDWKGKFEYWLTNNMYINKKTATLIIDHVQRYFPSPTPSSILPEGDGLNIGYNTILPTSNEKLLIEYRRLSPKDPEREKEYSNISDCIMGNICNHLKLYGKNKEYDSLWTSSLFPERLTKALLRAMEEYIIQTFSAPQPPLTPNIEK